MNRFNRTTIRTYFRQIGASDRSIRAASFTFILTRGAVFTVFILAAHLNLLEPRGDFGRSPQETQISLSSASVISTLRRLAHSADSGWYWDIASNGYEHQAFDAALLISCRWDFRLLNFTAALLALASGVVLAVRRQWALGLYVLSAVVASLSSMVLQSQARYVMVLFPVFIVLAIAGRSRRVDITLSSVFMVVLGLMTALCSIVFTLALS